MIHLPGGWSRRIAARKQQAQIARKIRVGRRRGEAIELSRDEALYMFDRLARRELGISGEDFLRLLDSGDLPDTPIVEHLALLAGGARARA